MRDSIERVTDVCVVGPDIPSWLSGPTARPGILPYGLEALTDNGIRLGYARRSSNLKPILGRVDYWTSYQIQAVLPALTQASRSDRVLSIFEKAAVTYDLVRRFRPELPSQVVVACWMAEQLLGQQSLLFNRFRRMAEGAEAIVVFSANQVDIIRQSLGKALASRCQVVDFGVCLDFFTPGGCQRDEYVAVVGHDAGRDWMTFKRVAERTPDVRYRLMADDHVSALGMPTNVEILGRGTHVEYRELLRRASFSLIVTHPVAYPTGQSVLLEGLACGTPAVVTATPANRSYLDPGAVLPCQVGDPESIAQSVLQLWKNGEQTREMGMAARTLAEARFDSRQMWAAAAPLLSS